MKFKFILICKRVDPPFQKKISMQILELEAPFRKWADQPYPLGKFGAHFSNGHPQ